MEVAVQKKYIVELTVDERSVLEKVVKETCSKWMRAAQDGRIGAFAEALDCRTKTVENVRQRFGEQGFDVTLNGQKPREASLRVRRS